MKTCGGSGDIAPFIPSFGTRWRWVLSCIPPPRLV